MSPRPWWRRGLQPGSAHITQAQPGSKFKIVLTVQLCCGLITTHQQPLNTPFSNLPSTCVRVAERSRSQASVGPRHGWMWDDRLFGAAGGGDAHARKGFLHNMDASQTPFGGSLGANRLLLPPPASALTLPLPHRNKPPPPSTVHRMRVFIMIVFKDSYPPHTHPSLSCGCCLKLVK